MPEVPSIAENKIEDSREDQEIYPEILPPGVWPFSLFHIINIAIKKKEITMQPRRS
jgi:hypothetical protein